MIALSCDLCDHVGQGNNFEEWAKNLQPHYMQAHADFMKEKGEASAEEQQAGMMKWMEDNKKRFDREGVEVKEAA